VIRRILVAIVLAVVVGIAALSFGLVFDGKLTVSGTISRQYQWFTDVVPSTGVALLTADGIPCESGMTDANGKYSFELVIGSVCRWNDIVVAPGTWIVSVPYHASNSEVVLADELSPVVDILVGAN
jgi:hypothetical protein